MFGFGVALVTILLHLIDAVVEMGGLTKDK